jgi:hypothetical protein
MSTSELLRHLIDQPPGIALNDLAPLALLDRTDHKFVLNPEQLHELLAAVLEHYTVLQVGGVRRHRYLTTYFDTPDLALYFDHHNGKRSRYKLRCRTYLDSDVAFVEAKMKTNKERTVKYRRQVPEHVTRLDALSGEWLPPSLPYPLETMQAVVWNRFVRVTLANFTQNERVTIDVDIVFGSGDQWFSHEGLCIIEVKQPKFSLMRSPLTRQLHRMHLQPQSISKFCIAAAHFYPSCKTNYFKPLTLQLTRCFPLRGPL